MRYDTTLKDVLWRGAPALLRQVAGAAAIRLETLEYPSTRTRRPDFVARLETGSLFHLELQGTADADMAWRMLEYYRLISGHHDGDPIRQCVLAVTEADARRMGGGISHPDLQFRYDVRSFEMLDPVPLLASDRADETVLAILCRTSDIRGRVRSILDRLADLDDKARQDAVLRLMILSNLRHAAEVVTAEVRTMPIHIDLMDNPVIRKFVIEESAKVAAKAATAAAAEAAEKATAQGMAQGMAQGQAKTLLRLLDRRFPGQVTETQRARIIAAPSEEIEGWTDRLFEAASVDDVLAD